MTEKWDLRFLDLANHAATWSKDPSTQCGAAIVRPDKTVASLGFNGFPKGCSDAPELYEDREQKYARVVHAEVNAIIHAREPLEGYTMYTYPGNFGPTCDRCATLVIQSGIKRIVHIGPPDEQEDDFADRWRQSVERGLKMYEEAGVKVEQIPFADWLERP